MKQDNNVITVIPRSRAVEAVCYPFVSAAPHQDASMSPGTPCTPPPSSASRSTYASVHDNSVGNPTGSTSVGSVSRILHNQPSSSGDLFSRFGRSLRTSLTVSTEPDTGAYCGYHRWSIYEEEGRARWNDRLNDIRRSLHTLYRAHCIYRITYQFHRFIEYQERE